VTHSHFQQIILKLRIMWMQAPTLTSTTRQELNYHNAMPQRMRTREILPAEMQNDATAPLAQPREASTNVRPWRETRTLSTRPSKRCKLQHNLRLINSTQRCPINRPDYAIEHDAHDLTDVNAELRKRHVDPSYRQSTPHRPSVIYSQRRRVA
jgi:hypothetical protein